MSVSQHPSSIEPSSRRWTEVDCSTLCNLVDELVPCLFGVIHHLFCATCRGWQNVLLCILHDLWYASGEASTCIWLIKSVVTPFTLT